MRPDKRSSNQIRPISIRLGVIETADGSAEFALGETRVLASVHGPVGAKGRLEQIDRTTVKVSVESFSSAPSLKDIAMAERIEKMLLQVIFEMLNPRTLVAITIQPLSLDGSFLTVAVNAAICALLDSGIPMKRVGFTACCIADANSAELLIDPSARECNTPHEYFGLFDPLQPESSLALQFGPLSSPLRIPEISKFLFENGVRPVSEAVMTLLQDRLAKAEK